MDERLLDALGMRRAEPEDDAPSVEICRHAVLAISDARANGEPHYVVYDRLYSRVVDGVYMFRDDALGVAALLNTEEGLRGYEGRPPNGDALDLTYPADS